MLTVRKPAIATPNAHLDWSPVPEFAHIFNGSSVMIPYVEHYLNNVMRTVETGHCADDPALVREIGQFIRQEATHARYHLAFNKQMFEAGYEALKPLIAETVAELQVLREKRSLAFNIAYCAGFETTATFSAKYLMERCDSYFRDCDSYGANLLQWHVAEEFEHRATCHKAFQAVSGNYVIRIAGLAYSFWHIKRTFDRATRIVLAHYRAGMDAAERRGSIRKQKRLERRQMRYMLPRMIRLLSPFYDPQKLTVPPRIEAALAFYSRPDPITISFADAQGRPTVA
jgi:predicted metal-dependent hydrolase